MIAGHKIAKQNPQKPLETAKSHNWKFTIFLENASVPFKQKYFPLFDTVQPNSKLKSYTRKIGTGC